MIAVPPTPRHESQIALSVAGEHFSLEREVS
jgi:hypothetical protein